MKATVFDTPRDKVLLFFIYILLTIIGIITFYPFWDLFVLSLSPYEESFRIGIRLFPANPTLASYVRVLSNPEIGMGYYNTILRTVLGTATGVLITFLTAYPLSKKNLPFNGVITLLFVFTMIFNAGLIPNYLNLERLGTPMFLSLVTVDYIANTIPDSLLLDKVMKILLATLKQNLRRGDTISRYSPYQYALLLPTVNHQTGQVVLERVKKAFYSESITSQFVMNYKLQPIGQDM